MNMGGYTAFILLGEKLAILLPINFLSVSFGN